MHAGARNQLELLDAHELAMQELVMQELEIVTQEVDNEHQLELLDELLVGLAGEATSSTSAASS